jgi:hypothetical protein
MRAVGPGASQARYVDRLFEAGILCPLGEATDEVQERPARVDLIGRHKRT